jgi:UDP-GlcNAc:undecaprenyl-phosphate/decaprenyl-phosphate GlcNAc-1-phosphate transferase
MRRVFLAMLVSGVAARLVLRVLYLRQRSASSGKVPQIAGLSAAAGFFAGAAVFFGADVAAPPLRGILAGSLIIAVGSAIDDRRELSVAGKLLWQCAAIAAAVAGGVSLHIGALPVWANLFGTILWLLALTNAFNHLDVADGVLGSITLIAAAGLLLVAWTGQQYTAVVLALLAIAAVAVLLKDNLPPAKAYFGNTGSHFLGFLLASVAVVISYAPSERPVALLSPLLILGFPLFDTLYLVWIRAVQGRAPHRKSDDHLVLRFLRGGYPIRRALAWMASLAALFVAAGVFVAVVPPPAAYAAVAVAVCSSVIVAWRMSRVRIR